MKKMYIILIFILLPFLICGNTLTKEEQARTLFNKAITLRREGENKKALQICNEIIEQYPSTQTAIDINMLLLIGNQQTKTKPPSPQEQDEIPQNMASYQDQVWNLIKSQWLIPDSGYDKGKELLTVISIRVLKDGSVQDIKFESESGEAVFDKSALLAIKRAGKFPPFPKEMLKDSIEIGIRFSP